MTTNLRYFPTASGLLRQTASWLSQFFREAVELGCISTSAYHHLENPEIMVGYIMIPITDYDLQNN
jgi:hypothetical protein